MSRKLLILFLTVLVAVVTGCGGAHRYDSRLTLVDSLMKAAPDSALTLVEALPTSTLTTDHDRAYHDLLLTQARYKCYITATSDSDINRALDYYRNHLADREKLTRAYIYKGAVMQELDHPDSAMLYYKKAEAVADPSDDFNRGLCNLRIGKLYQNYYASADSAVKACMCKAMDCFIACQDTNYIIISMGDLGSYMHHTNNDSAIKLLNQAISLARSTRSIHQYYYQSKLAGIYFYQQDYPHAKEFAMDIINNGKERCDEKTFYYYAARSFIKLRQLDSARWVASIIPSPVLPIDSFNHYLLQAELAEARHDNQNYNRYSACAERIHRKLLESSSNPALLIKELECDASLHQAELESEYNTIIIWIVVLLLIALTAIVVGSRIIVRRKDIRYQHKLDITQQEIKRMVDISEKQISELLAQREKDKTQIKRINKEKHQLEKQQESINRQAAKIVKYRNSALNELYLSIKIKKTSENEKNRYLPLMETLKELWEKRNTLKMDPSDSFWNNLRLSVEGEYPGIVSFVEQKYPNLSSRDLQLFLLMCAGFPNQIINICMNYTGDATASKRKAILFKEKMGLDMKIDQFIDMYINGKLGNK